MALGEAESGLFGLFTNQSANVFESMSTGLECLGAGGVQDGSGVLLNQVTESHNRAQRLRTACVEGALCPLAALLAQHRCSVDPITARGQHRSAEAAGSQGVAELAGFPPSVHPNLFHALVEDLHATAIPADPDFAADQFGRRFVKGFFDFHVAVPMYATASFLEAGKKRCREWLQVRAFFFKTGGHLLARRAVDALVGDTAFPMTQEEVFLGKGLESPPLECIG